MLLALLSHSLCLNVRPHPSVRAAAARTGGLRRGGGAALSAQPPRPRQAAEGTMTDDLEVLDVGIGGETPSDFAALGVLRMRVAANLAAMNISAPNALQSACFGPLLGGRDAIVQAHTGSGKTIAFLLPLIEQLDPSSSEPQAPVISPSRELAFQTARVAEALLAGTGLSCAALSGGANPNRQMDKVRKTRPLLDSFKDGRPLQLVFASATSDAPAVRRAASQLMREPLMLRLTRTAAAGGGGGGRGGGDAAAALPSTIVHGCVVLPQRKHMEA